ncbi:MAG: hypothetical protein AAF517_25890, partial [Planctomycetota bacterium]
VYADEPESFDLDRGAAEDLAVFEGPRNLFSVLDVSSTILGGRRLHYLLSHPLKSREAILERQRATSSMADSTTTRRRLLEALFPLRSHSFKDIPLLLGLPVTLAGSTGLLIAAHVLGTLAPVSLVASAFDTGYLSILFLVGVLNLGLIGSQVRKSNPARDRLLQFAPLLKSLLELERVLSESQEKAKSDPNWQAISKELSALAPDLHRLEKWCSRLELHSYGLLFEVINILLLWELRILPIAERVFERNRDGLERAIGALSEIEALLALSCALAEQEGFRLPEPLESEDPTIQASELGHPLLENRVVVRNPVSLESENNVLIVTGSNMAGKSTYLKSIGLNVLLAGIGGPVSAKSFRWTPLRVYSDINVRDSLDDGKSYFQVEVERVLDVIRESESSRCILAVFDELFRGTNAEERLYIARSLLKYLQRSGILLIVATHDNKLTRLVTDENTPGMRNSHFRENVDGQTMTFDYRLHEGPTPTRNAIRVLEAAGYPVEITKGAHDEMN